jgi:hypothetical protein
MKLERTAATVRVRFLVLSLGGVQEETWQMLDTVLLRRSSLQPKKNMLCWI